MAKKEFINNKEFYALLVNYKNTADETHPEFDLIKNKEIHNKLGEIFLLMVDKFQYHHWYVNYTADWKAEMSSEAIYNCCRYFRNFDVEKNNNPFAYFTRVIWNSYQQMLNKERKIKKQRDIISDSVWDGIEHLLPTNGQPMEMESLEIVTSDSKMEENSH